MKPQPNWEFLNTPDKMGNTSDVMLKVFAHRGFSDEELLAREGLQNCQDARSQEAADNALPVQVTVEKSVVSRQEKARLFKALQLDQQTSKASLLFNDEVLKSYGTTNKSAAFKKYLTDESPVSIVSVTDENTVGLGGALRFNGTKEDYYCHFKRLVSSLGQSDKPEGGGSFGFGKTVFAKLSRINLVLFYSRFKPTAATDGASARFMAVWLLRKDLGKDFSGFAFFGQKAGKGGTSIPFTDQEADSMAELCGIRKRGVKDYGTTVAVVDCPVDMSAVRFAIEKYWWPSMSDKKISVRVIDQGKPLDVRPSENPVVQPYIEMYGALKKRHEKPDAVKIDAPFNRSHKLNLGQMSLRILDQSWVTAARDYALKQGISKDSSYPVGGGAKIRKPGMVIKYEGGSTPDSEPVVAAIFLADDDIDSVLRASEPSSHDDWDSTEKQRIEEAGAKLNLKPGQAVEIVTSVNKRIERRLSDARRELAPPPPSEDARLQLLEKMLSDVLSAGQPIGKPEFDPRPFSISIDTSNEISADQRIDKAKVTLSLKPDYDGDEIACNVQVEGKVLEGPSSGSGTAVPLELESENKRVSGKRPSLACVVKRGSPVQLLAVASCGKKEVVRFIVKVMNPKLK
jgi:hypothetical protein